MRTNRIEGLVDGIFAIAMTLLVLDIRVPAVDPLQLHAALINLLPKFLTFFMSFVILGIFWVGQHNQMNFIHKSDRAFLWLNILFCMSISLVPFSAGLIGEFPFSHASTIIYALNLIGCGLFLLAMWNHAYRAGLIEESVTPEFVAQVRWRILKTPIMYPVAVAASFLPGAWGHISLPLFLLPIAFYVLPGNIDRFWR